MCISCWIRHFGLFDLQKEGAGPLTNGSENDFFSPAMFRPRLGSPKDMSGIFFHVPIYEPTPKISPTASFFRSWKVMRTNTYLTIPRTVLIATKNGTNQWRSRVPMSILFVCWRMFVKWFIEIERVH